MANVQRRSQTGVGASAAIYPSAGNPFNVGMGCVVSGTVTYTIEHSFDSDSNDWFSHSDLVNKSSSTDGNYAFPVAAIRINVTAGTGTVTLAFLQSTRS